MKNNHQSVFIKFVAILFLAFFLVSCSGASSTPTSVPTIQASSTPMLAAPTTEMASKSSHIPFNNDNLFLLGANYPWLNYGHDFGSTTWGHDGVSFTKSKSTIEADFSYLQNQGVHVVRWFLFADGRASPEFDAEGKVTGLDEYFYNDLDAALAIAQKHNIYLILVLFDFHLADKASDVKGVQVGGRSQIITNLAKQQTFLDNALKPLLEKYGSNDNILAWEVMNEPEGAMNVPDGQWVGDSVNSNAMQAFVNKVVTYIHTYSTRYATIGSASRRWLSYWTDSKLDFYQYHYYDKMESQFPLDYPYADIKLDKPCIVGEFPTKNTNRTVSQYLDTIWNGGYAGALAWSYRAEDDASDFKSTSSEFKIWSDAHQVDVKIGSPK